MDFNKSPAITRIALFAVTAGVTGILISRSDTIPSLIGLGLLVYLGRYLLQHLESPKASDLDAIQFDELTQRFKTDQTNAAAIELSRRINEIFQATRSSSRPDRDTEYLFYKNIVLHAGIGLIIFREDGRIEIINTAARKLLKVTRMDHINELTAVSPTLLNVFQKLRTGGRELLRLKIGEEIVQLSVYAIELILRGDKMKLVSLQNIQNELEEKEMEAWQNLVRVLTHEIMNSVTPISSLAGTIEDDLKPYLNGNERIVMDTEKAEDVRLSLQTISRRSESLIQFVKEFRSLTHIPKPKVQSVAVKPLIDEVAILLKKEITEKNIRLETTSEPEDLTILADKGMISQVLINLMKNAIQAFEEEEDRYLEVKGFVNPKLRPVIVVRDNGPGIDAEALEKIFIPFYTTKKNGSGIGLSLSRQIMRQHQGSLTVNSEPGKGTEFFLRF